MHTKRTAAVIGGASGIGAAVADRLAGRGDDVYVLDRVLPPTPRVRFIECDLRDPAAIDKSVHALPDGLSAVAYVAGLPGTRPAPDVLAVNFLAVRHLLHAILPKVIDSGALAIVASCAGVAWSRRLAELEPLLAASSFQAGLDWLAENPSDYPLYSTTKEAVIVFAKRLSASLWAERGIRVNTVSPGPVETPILGDFEESMGKDILDGVRRLSGRHGTPADVAPVVEAVLNPSFGWVNGQDIQVDAGSTTALLSGAATLPTS